MAHISKAASGWRAQVARLGTRISKTFPERAQAEAWAHVQERRILDTKFRNRLAHLEEDLASIFPRRVLEAIAAAPVCHADILGGAIPAPDICGVYFLIRAGEIVYVGKSQNVLLRLAKHRNNGKKFDAYNVFHCKQEELDRYERLYITALMPIENGSLGCVDATPLTATS